MADLAKLTSAVDVAAGLINQPGAGAVLAEVKGDVEVLEQAAKSGYKSSEFLLTAGTFALGVLICGVKLYQGQFDMTAVGVFLGTCAKVAAYSKGRSDLKAAHVDAK